VPRPILVTYDLGALRRNFSTLRSRVPSARIWAVVKSNAYGHGLVRTARTLKEADGFAVAEINDAVRLRDAGVHRPILLLEGFFEARDVAVCVDYMVHVVLHTTEQLAMLERTVVKKPLDVYLKMNTGMNRLGFSPVRFGDAHRRLTSRARVNSISLMTHFADADGPSGIAEQLARFNEGTRMFQGERSAANSAAMLRFPESHFDWVRPGISLYGCSPFADETAAELALEPVMTLSSRLIGVQELEAGERVGYGGAFVAAQDMRVGVVACGYADGYPRHAPSGTPILVNGRRTTVLGRVSMEMIAVDLTRLPDAQVGSEVTLWGQGLSADEVAKSAGTVSYELLTAVSTRIPVVERE
jgi:alanine racemase